MGVSGATIRPLLSGAIILVGTVGGLRGKLPHLLRSTTDAPRCSPEQPWLTPDAHPIAPGRSQTLAAFCSPAAALDD